MKTNLDSSPRSQFGYGGYEILFIILYALEVFVFSAISKTLQGYYLVWAHFTYAGTVLTLPELAQEVEMGQYYDELPSCWRRFVPEVAVRIWRV